MGPLANAGVDGPGYSNIAIRERFNNVISANGYMVRVTFTPPASSGGDIYIDRCYVGHSNASAAQPYDFDGTTYRDIWWASQYHASFTQGEQRGFQTL